MKNSILRKQPWFNPYFYGNAELEKIVIFKDGQILHSFKWFGSNNNHPEIQFHEIKTRRKIDLEKKEVFYNGGKLYIHADICKFTPLAEEINYTTETHRHYRTKFAITLNCSHNEAYLDELGQVQRRLTAVEPREIQDYFNHRSEETADAQRLQTIADKFKEITREYISARDIIELEKVFNIKFL